MKGSASIDITSDNHYIIYPTAQVADTHHIGIEPVEKYATLDEVIQHLPRIVQLSKQQLSMEEESVVTKKASKQQFKLAGVRSNLAYGRECRTIDLTEESGIITLYPSKRDRRSHYAFLPQKSQRAPLSDKQALLSALEKAITSCE